MHKFLNCLPGAGFIALSIHSGVTGEVGELSYWGAGEIINKQSNPIEFWVCVTLIFVAGVLVIWGALENKG